MINSFQPLNQLISKIYRDAGLSAGQVDHDDVTEWCLFALREISAYGQYHKKTAELIVEGFQALLPQDFYLVDEELFTVSYKIQLNSIITSSKSGKMQLHYLAFATDENGELLIPDLTSYEEALTWYVYSKLCLRGQFPNKQVSWEYANDRYASKKLEARAEAGYLSSVAQQNAAQEQFNLRKNTYAHRGRPFTRR